MEEIVGRNIQRQVFLIRFVLSYSYQCMSSLISYYRIFTSVCPHLSRLYKSCIALQILQPPYYKFLQFSDIDVKWSCVGRKETSIQYLKVLPYNPFSNCWKKSEPCPLPWQQDIPHHSGQSASDTYHLFIATSLWVVANPSQFHLLTLYRPFHPTVWCQNLGINDGWDSCRHETCLTSEESLQPVAPSLVLKGSFLLQEHPLDVIQE
jgi:hypothetical protein